MSVEKSFNSASFLKKLFWGLVLFEAFILFSDAFLNYARWIDSRALRRVFNITREDSLANWFSSLQALFVAATVFLIIYFIDHKKWQRRGWALIGFFFLFVAIDDATKFHERVGTAFREGFGSIMQNYSSYAWQVALGPAFALMGGFIFLFLWREMSKERKRIFLALSLFAFAIFLDYLEGKKSTFFDSMASLLHQHKVVVIHFVKAIEEVIEMLATTIFLIAFLRHLLAQTNEIRLKWTRIP